MLIGGAGNDTYTFNANFGHDIIKENDATEGNLDRIVFAAGVTPEQVSVQRDAMDLLLSAGSENQIRVKDWFADVAHRVEQVEFANGVTWTADDLLHMSNHVPAVNTALSRQAATEDTPFSYALSEDVFVDQDRDMGDRLTLSATLDNGEPLPEWLGFDAVTRTFRRHAG